MSSLRRGHANLLCIVPIFTDDPEGFQLTMEQSPYLKLKGVTTFQSRSENKRVTPPAGFEPATFGLEVRRAIRCAMEAINYLDPGGTRTHNR